MTESLVRSRFRQLSAWVTLFSLSFAASSVACAQVPPAPVIAVPAAGTTVRGRLTDRGQPLAATTVAFYDSQKRLAGSAETDSSGNYQTSSLAPGSYTARVVRAGGFAPLPVANFSVDTPAASATPLLLPEWHAPLAPAHAVPAAPQTASPPDAAPPPAPPVPLSAPPSTPRPVSAAAPAPDRMTLGADRLFYVTDRAQGTATDSSSFNALPEDECADLPGCTLRYGSVAMDSSDTTSLQVEQFFSQVAFAARSDAKRDVVLYIHGCCTDFATALTEERLVAADISSAPVIVYSIPAKNNTTLFPGIVMPLNYFYDENEYTWSFPHLTKLLDELLALRPAVRINVLAHSLGNRVFISAAQLFAYEHRSDRAAPFGNVVLLAPDVDTQTFVETAPLLRELGAHITVYRSDNDEAIHGSQIIHEHPRLGRVDKSQYFSGIAPAVDAIDATTFKCEATGHFYWKLSSIVRADIAAALSDVRPTASRRASALVATGPASWQFQIGSAINSGDCPAIPTNLDG